MYRQQRKLDKEQAFNSLGIEIDENFAFIVGYTSGSFPYGISHEEMEEFNKPEIE